MTTLWDTNSGKVVQALTAERRAAGAVASGLVLTLVAVVDERSVPIAFEAATAASMTHPCRLLTIVRRQPDAAEPRLDAEVTVGGHLGPGESVVLRVYGRLANHAESVVLPLLASDTPVVTWWYGEPPQRAGLDPLGALASRRITDSAAAPDPLAALRQRAIDYQIGDTDLVWTRLTSWRALLASSFDSVTATPRRVVVGSAQDGIASAWLLAAWLGSRLGVPAEVLPAAGPAISEVSIELDSGTLRIDRPDGRSATLQRPGQTERQLPLPIRDLGELLAEELRRLDADEPYADALAAFAGGAVTEGETQPAEADAAPVA
ncbi:glucose-6-phosphate dehydrogenase assembly protein OpcA [Acidothermaceae bacterium B102]|nr:glucose-6-phosphate dehydrogenase assembly protein OpcA [Acidothermaceae bacterium B102]